MIISNFIIIKDIFFIKAIQYEHLPKNILLFPNAKELILVILNISILKFNMRD